jgi:gas vesicle protein
MEQQAKQTGWFFIGAGIGMAIAMLLAPASGEETRRRLKDRLQRGRENIEGAAESAADAIDGALEEARDNPTNRLAKSKALEEGLNHISEKE